MWFWNICMLYGKSIVSAFTYGMKEIKLQTCLLSHDSWRPWKKFFLTSRPVLTNKAFVVISNWHHVIYLLRQLDTSYCIWSPQVSWLTNFENNKMVYCVWDFLWLSMNKPFTWMILVISLDLCINCLAILTWGWRISAKIFVQFREIFRPVCTTIIELGHGISKQRGMCDQQSLRSASAYAQSDQCLC